MRPSLRFLVVAVAGWGAVRAATLGVLPAIYAILQSRAAVRSVSLNPMDPESRYYEHP